MSTTYNVIGFGDLREHTLPWVVFNAPNYFYWGIENQLWSRYKHLKRQAERLDHLSRHILIPYNESGFYQVHYLVPISRRVLRKVLVLPWYKEPPINSLPYPFTVDLTSNVIDLSYAAYLNPGDNHYGPTSIVETISHWYNGPRVTIWPEGWPMEWSEGFFPEDGDFNDEWCQEFFSNDRNFQETARIKSPVHQA